MPHRPESLLVSVRHALLPPRPSLLIALLLGSMAAGLARAADTNSPVIHLFNGRDLVGWETWLGAPSDGAPVLGWNHDPRRVFTVVTNDSAPAIRCSGEVCGSLVTRAEFENYRLRLEFKWGTKR